MNKKYKCVIFDLDGTMLNTERMNMIPLQRLIKEELDKDIPYKDILKYRAYPGLKVIEELGFRDVNKSYEKWVKYVNEFEEGATLYSGCDDLVKELHRRGIVCAISSSKMKKQYEIDFHPANLQEYISCVVLAEDTENHKPHPEPLLKVTEILKIAPEECIYIGDTIFDYRATKAAGMDFALAAWGATNTEGINGDFFLEEAMDLIKYIE